MDINKTLLSLVEELNSEFFERTSNYDIVPFSYFDTGYVCGIKFMNYEIYNSDVNTEYHHTEDRKLTREEIGLNLHLEIKFIIDSLNKWSNERSK